MNRFVAAILFVMAVFLHGPSVSGTAGHESGAGRTAPLVDCSNCSLDLMNPGRWKERLVAPSKPVAAPIWCAACGLEFPSADALQQHLREHPEHRTAPLVDCMNCSLDLINPGRWKEQLTSPAQPVAAPIRCTACGLEFSSGEGLQQHLREHPEHRTAPLIDCSNCGLDYTRPDRWKEKLRK
ncbi:C2H2-type zinc finger protein [Desulfuromonas sp. CSMB_57]|uniref:C2H2-type zinc finger protein n=1 Tax=Desulfuromonas sp. CSMB_57 TaxID=2807629 RepID=UPI0020BF3E51|nr:C2H2-type zinc finger protein [Desulfuromonas sp. CSMB_57]